MPFSGILADPGSPLGLLVLGSAGTVIAHPITATVTATAYSANVGGTGPAFKVASPPSGSTGIAYSYQFVASGNPSYSLASGSPPTGLTLSTSGLLSGVPSAPGSFTFTVQAISIGGSSMVTPTVTIILVNWFTPPFAKDRPPYLPDSTPEQVGLWRHFATRVRGVNVFALSDGTFCQDTATAENTNTNIPYPWNPNDPSGPYSYVQNWDGTITKTSHAFWITGYWAGGHASYQLTSPQVTALTSYTAHGTGYSDCITPVPVA